MAPKPESYGKNHYAVYPRMLISPLLQATAPTRTCPVCGAPWCPVVKRGHNPYPGSSHDHTRDGEQGNTQTHASGIPAGTIMARRWYEKQADIVTAHRPTCDCRSDDTYGVTYQNPGGEIDTLPFDPIPGWVLDPFVGSGTTLEVCAELGVNCVGLDISPEYLDEHAKPRIGLTPAGALETLPLFEGMGL